VASRSLIGLSYAQEKELIHEKTSYRHSQGRILAPLLIVTLVIGITGIFIPSAYAASPKDVNTPPPACVSPTHSASSGCVLPKTVITGATNLDSNPTLASWNNQLWVGYIAGNSPSTITLQASSDGYNFGSPVLLTDTALDGPSLTTWNGHLYIAWMGTDNPSTIWIGYYNPSDPTHLSNHYGTGIRVTFQPSIITFNGLLYMAWIDGTQHIHLASSSNGETFNNQITLTDTSGYAPRLAVYNGHLYVVWHGTDGFPGHIWLGYYNPGDPTHLSNHTGLSATCGGSPALGVYNNQLWLAWTGTDSAGHLNSEESSDGINYSNKVTYTDTSQPNYGPSEATFTAGGVNSIYMAWVGTDSLMSLNVSIIG
jgi:hypothetical protein